MSIKSYTQFINESRKDRKALKAAAKAWVSTSSEEERNRIKAKLKEEGYDMTEFTSAIGDAYDSQW